jgi:V/A-type H+-transporting ATPase subunit A
VWALDRDLAYARHYPAVSWQGSFSRDIEGVARWHAANGDPDWAVRRARLQSLLAESVRLQGIADLVGLAAMPTMERMVLLAARLAREAVLQQSALSVNDASCALSKQTALAQAVLDVYDTATELARASVPATVLEDVDYGPLVRSKETAERDDADGVTAIAADLVALIKKLARQ